MNVDRDPARPGIPVNLDQLKNKSRKEHQVTRAQNEPVAMPFTDPVRPPAPQPAAPPPAAIPDSFEAGAAPVAQRIHPLLKQLNQEFGLERLKTEIVEMGNHRWSFRPKDYSSLEWVTERLTLMNQESGTITGVSAIHVAAHLALVDGVPVYEIFNIETTGRHIADKGNPPADIKRQASEAVLSWLREDIGLTEIIEALETKFEVLYERQRRDAFPLWQTLANTYQKMLVSVEDEPTPTPETTANASPSGAVASPSREPSPPTTAPASSGAAPTP